MNIIKITKLELALLRNLLNFQKDGWKNRKQIISDNKKDKTFTSHENNINKILRQLVEIGLLEERSYKWKDNKNRDHQRFEYRLKNDIISFGKIFIIMKKKELLTDFVNSKYLEFNNIPAEQLLNNCLKKEELPEGSPIRLPYSNLDYSIYSDLIYSFLMNNNQNMERINKFLTRNNIISSDLQFKSFLLLNNILNNLPNLEGYIHELGKKDKINQIFYNLILTMYIRLYRDIILKGGSLEKERGILKKFKKNSIKVAYQYLEPIIKNKPEFKTLINKNHAIIELRPYIQNKIGGLNKK